MKLENDYDIQRNLNRVEYKRNENGLYTIDIKDYVIATPDGQEYEAFLRFPNVKLPIDDESGVIDLKKEDISYLAANDEHNNTIWEIILSDNEE